MKRILYVILAAAAVLLGNYFFSNGTFEASVETPTAAVIQDVPLQAAPSAVPVGTDISYAGTTFNIPVGLGTGTQNEIVPQSPLDVPFAVWPAHTKIVLQGYPLQDTTFQPQIRVFPADEYQKISADPETDLYDAASMITSLKSILSTGNFPAPDAIPNTFPFLPSQSARQVFHAQKKILTFQNGQGIRYLTQFSQAVFPLINNQDILYVFQGLTSDGKYYVSVIMPINLPYLAADYGPSGESVSQTSENYPTYLSTTINQLEQLEGGANPFAPSLVSLDTLVQSLLAGAPSASEVTPSTAEPVTSVVEKSGAWITNLGKLNIKQTGSEITASLAGYGNLGRKDTLQGTANENAVTLNSQLLGDLSLVFSGNTFKTIEGGRISFCGIRASESKELPDGCGFSGKWNLSSSSFFPEGSFVVLKQTAEAVTGDFYDGKGNAFDKLTGLIYWGKGWGMTGKNEKGHTVNLLMNSSELGFEYVYDELYQLQLCGVRDGVNSVDLGNFICSLKNIK